MFCAACDVSAAVRLSRRTLQHIHQNLFWAFFYNLILIPVAAGLTPLKINPMMGAAAMSLSSFTVCMNALRLNLFDMHNTAHDRPLKHPASPAEKVPAAPQTVQETVLIEGMMCEHCEARIEKAIGSLEGVTEVKADHTSGTAVITATAMPDTALIRQAVEAQDYQFAGIAGQEDREPAAPQTVQETVMRSSPAATQVAGVISVRSASP